MTPKVAACAKRFANWGASVDYWFAEASGVKRARPGCRDPGSSQVFWAGMPVVSRALACHHPDAAKDGAAMFGDSLPFVAAGEKRL